MMPGSSRTGRQMNAILSRLRRAINQRMRRRKWVMVIVNPAAGQVAPDLKLFNKVIHQAGLEWELEVTNTFGDGARLAARAVAGGASLVAACGGDGTVMDVAAGVLGSQVPMAILPSGTGNVLAKELAIPMDLPSACALMVDPAAVQRPIDLGVTNDRWFLLRLGVGLEAEVVRATDRSLKDRLGLLAYIAATVQAWTQMPTAHYHLELDGEPQEMDGLAVMIANAAALGIPGLTLSPQVRIDDGLLDVFVVRRPDLAELAAFAATFTNSPPSAATLPHWQVRTVKIDAFPTHGVEADGEALGVTPVEASVVPGALKVIVPKPNKPAV
jgi:diacylglycerol kinase (ATP)